MKYFDLFKSTMRQSNQSIKKVTIYFLKPIDLSSLNTLHFTTTRSSTFSWFNFALLGVTTLPWHWEYHLVELGRKGELRLVMLPPAFQWWFVGVTFGWVVLAQKTLCNGAIKIVSQVSPNFGCLFFWNNAVVLDGGHGYRLKRWICSDYISILSQHYLNNITFICLLCPLA